ncbi:AT-rich interactive domain-containing protein 3C [Trichinella spiralis]|uniref:AT-rich interactive domain-containing protein 3C n=1 Tax=Trichinella spiralis TaxID=6334 RepID=A0ABR3K5I4_TRISP
MINLNVIFWFPSEWIWDEKMRKLYALESSSRRVVDHSDRGDLRLRRMLVVRRKKCSDLFDAFAFGLG